MPIKTILLLAVFVSTLISSCSDEPEIVKIPEKEFKVVKDKLGYHNRYGKIEAAEKIASYGPGAIKALPMLLDNLNDKDPMVRRYIITAIGSLGPEAAYATKNLSSSLKDRDEECAKNAARAIVNLAGPAGEEIIFNFLKKQLKRLEDFKSENNRVDAAAIFGRLGAYATPATEYLGERLLYDRSDLVRKTSAEALGKIGSSDAVPYLVTALMPFPKDADRLLQIDQKVFFKLPMTRFSVYTLVPLTFEKVISASTTKKELKEIEKKAYSSHLFIQKKHIYFKNKHKKYIPLFDKMGRSKPWVKEIYIKNTSDYYTKIPLNLIINLNKTKLYPIAGKKIETFSYVRDAAAHSIKKITGQNPKAVVHAYTN